MISSLNLTNQFTAHNIHLDDGTFTMGSPNNELARHPRAESAVRLLRALFPQGCKGKRIVDLGCLEGGYAVEFARMGFDTLGIEVRSNNFSNCLYVKKHLDLPNLEFAQDSVWNIAKYGKFDAIYCCGLLYHLDRPVAFLELLSSLCNKALIVNTHYAATVGNHAKPTEKFVESEGVVGFWYDEHNAGSDEERERLKWASWENTRSFWPKKEYLPQMIKRAGFDLVFEQFDWVGPDILQGINDHLIGDSRVQFVGIKS